MLQDATRQAVVDDRFRKLDMAARTEAEYGPQSPRLAALQEAIGNVAVAQTLDECLIDRLGTVALQSVIWLAIEGIDVGKHVLDRWRWRLNRLLRDLLRRETRSGVSA